METTFFLCRRWSPSLVLASEQEREVEQDPEQEPPGHRDPQAAPLAEVRHALLFQNIHPGRQARRFRDPHPQSLAQILQQPHFHRRRHRPERRVVEDLNPPDKTLGRIVKLVL